MSCKWGMDANTAMRVPNTMRASPVCAASQFFRRCAGVRLLCMATTQSSPHCGAKRSRKRDSSCGVRLISGTITKICADGSLSSCDCAARKYTSVLPLPVLPKSRKGPLFLAMFWRTSACSGVESGIGAACWAASSFAFAFALVFALVFVFAFALTLALLFRDRRRVHCSALSSRSWLGKAAKATSPTLRW